MFILIEARSSDTIRGMKLQFSLTTLLVYMTVLAVVCAASVAIPIRAVVQGPVFLIPKPVYESTEISRSPTVAETLRRIAIWSPAAIAGTLAGMWLVRRVKSRRHTVADRIE